MGKRLGNIVYWFVGDQLSASNSYAERSKILLTFYLPIGYSILALLNIPLIFSKGLLTLTWISVIGLFLKLVTPFILKYNESPYKAALYFCFLNFVQNSLSFIYLGAELNLGAIPYFIVQVLYISFLLGARWAIGFVVAILTLLSTCQFLKLSGLVDFPVGLQTSQNVGPILVNITIVTVMLLYLLNEFSKSQAYSNFEIRKVHASLGRLNEYLKGSNTKIEAKKAWIDEQNEKIEDGMRYAKLIQETIEPSADIMKMFGASHFVMHLPKHTVSGDFYWADKQGSKRIWAVGDCTGHGVPGALISITGSHALKQVWQTHPDASPAEILTSLSERLEKRFSNSGATIRDGMDIALCIYDTASNALSFAGANNPVWIYRSAVGIMEKISGARRPIGAFGHEIPFTNHEVSVSPGDTIYLFSDGFPDQFGGDRLKKYKYRPFAHFLSSIQDATMDKQKELLLEEFNRWKGDTEQIDDVCVMGVSI